MGTTSKREGRHAPILSAGSQKRNFNLKTPIPEDAVHLLPFLEFEKRTSSKRGRVRKEFEKRTRLFSDTKREFEKRTRLFSDNWRTA
jgi:hypothetical protein